MKNNEEWYGKGIKFCHVGKGRGVVGHGGIMTIVTGLYRDGDIIRIRYGVSYCASGDRFIKGRGREISYGRYNVCPSYVELVGNEITHRGVMYAVLRDILFQNRYPINFRARICDVIDWYGPDSVVSSKCLEGRGGEDIDRYLINLYLGIHVSELGSMSKGVSDLWYIGQRMYAKRVGVNISTL